MTLSDFSGKAGTDAPVGVDDLNGAADCRIVGTRCTRDCRDAGLCAAEVSITSGLSGAVECRTARPSCAGNCCGDVLGAAGASIAGLESRPLIR